MARSNTTMKGDSSVSVVVPAFNEEQNLAATIESIHKALNDKFSRYEIIVVNDGSTDDTGKIADALAEQDPHLRVIHNPRNMGYGFSVLRGAGAADYEYVQLVPGDNEIPTPSIEAVSSKIGTADMVIPYMLNSRVRPFGRKVISWGFTVMMNVLFNMRLHYYNGPSAIRSDLLKTALVNTRGFAFQASILVQLIKQKRTFVEVGIILAPRRFGKSTMVSPKNLASVVKTIARLFWDTNITRRLRKPRYEHS